jgi:hypothetical protein
MKNESREGKCLMKLRKRPSQNQKPVPHRPKLVKPKRSPPTREFGTDLTNRPLLSPNDIPTTPSISSPTPPEVAPYLSNIVQHLSLTDQRFTARLAVRLAEHPQGEVKVNPEMRRVLLRWLLQVGRKFQVKEETMQICVQLIDLMLVLETARISKINFQLLGVAALFVASKYNEIHTFEADKYVYLCDGLYSLPQLFEMESLILTTTNFSLQVPTLHQFTQLTLEHYGSQHAELIWELNNLVMFDFSLFNRYQKQHLAAVTTYFALKLNNMTELGPMAII